MFGFNPIDFFVAVFLAVILFFLWLFMMALFGIWIATIFTGLGIGVLLAVGLSDKVKNRPQGLHLYIITYFNTPTQLRIPQKAEVRFKHEL